MRFKSKMLLFLVIYSLGYVASQNQIDFSGVCNDQIPSCYDMVNVVLVIDTSGSVGNTNLAYFTGFGRYLADSLAITNDDDPTGYARARIGLVEYSTTARIVTQIDDGRTAFLNGLDDVDNDGSSGYTNMYDALVKAQNALALADRQDVPKLIIFLNDGDANRGLSSDGHAAYDVAGNAFDQLAATVKAADIVRGIGATDGFDQDNMEKMGPTYKIDTFAEINTTRFVCGFTRQVLCPVIINPDSPQLDPFQTVSLNENHPLGPVYDIVYANGDADDNDVYCEISPEAPLPSPFQLDGDNCRIVINDCLDYETDPNDYMFTVIVRDRTYPAYFQSVQVDVEVLDDNDPPTFSNQAIDLDECHIPIPGDILELTASDPNNDAITFQIDSAMSSSYASSFSINGNMLRLENQLDFECDNPTVCRNIELYINVIDAPTSDSECISKKLVRIQVRPCNEPPIYVYGPNYPNGDEGNPIPDGECLTYDFFTNQVSGRLFDLYAIDEDLGLEGDISNEVLTYDLLNHNDRFELIKEENGKARFELRGGQTLEVGTYNLVVRVTDQDGMADTLCITIKVEKPPTPPEITNEGESAEICVAESLSTMTTVFQVTAEDVNGDSFTFSITPDTTFIIDINGNIKLKPGAIIDSEASGVSQPQVFVLTVTATDTTTLTSDPYTVTITVYDENDHAPVFTASPYAVTVSESATNGFAVLTVETTDSDATPDQRAVTYSTPIVGPFPFEVTTDGIIKVVDSTLLDFESGTTTYLIPVFASNVGVDLCSDDSVSARDQSATVFVEVTLRNENDNPPEITTDSFVCEATIDEDQAVDVSIVSFTVCDVDNLASLDITIAESTPYGIESTATTPGCYSVEVDVASLSALDVDIRGIGQPHPLEDTFNILIKDGEAEHELSVPCTITVKDVNDIDPEFDTDLMTSITIADDKTGTIFFLDATDLDLTNPNNALTYTIDNIKDQADVTLPAYLDLFDIVDPTTGDISVKSSPTPADLVPHVGDTFTITVKVVDNPDDPNDPVLFDFIDVMVTIVSSNINAPVIINKLEFDLCEESATTDVVGTVMVTDVDGDTAFTFELMGTTMFEIDASTGVIKAKQTFDYETTPIAQRVHTFQVKVTDENNNSVMGPVKITLKDKNEFAPVILGPMSFNVPENQSPVNLHTYQISDADAENPNNQLQGFELVGGDLDFFAITSAGALTLTQSLDFEDSDNNEKCVTIKATDQGVDCNDQPAPLSSTKEVCVTALDINEFPPVPNYPPGESCFRNDALSELSAINTDVVLVVATDDDTANVLNYEITDESVPFYVDRSGQVKVKSALDFDTDPTTYNFMVEVYDGNGRVGEINVCITLIDANDNHPIFPPALNGGDNHVEHDLEECISEADKANFLTVTATDADGSSSFNQVVNYEIASTVPAAYASHFSINANGEISLVMDLDYEVDYGTIILKVVAVDNDGKKTPIDEAFKVIIHLQDCPEPPCFENNPITKNFYENTADQTEDVLSTPIASFIANDPDDVPTALTYTIVDPVGETRFRVESENNVGKVYSNELLDFEADDTSYTLTIRVSDDTGLSSSDGCDLTLTLKLLNVNEAPVFDSPEYRFKFSETTYGIDDEVACISASDVDGVIGQIAGYTLIDESSTNTNDPDRNNDFMPYEVPGPPEKRLCFKPTVVLDYGKRLSETGGQSACYQYFVEASDTGGLTAKTLVEFCLTDDNNNPPIFTEIAKTAYVDDTDGAGTTVATAHALDADFGINGEIRYRIIGGNEDGQFAIDDVTGDITLVSPIDPDTAPDNYALTIEAYNPNFPADPGNPNLTSNPDLVVTIGVKDNRNFPPVITTEFPSPGDYLSEEDLTYSFTVNADDLNLPDDVLTWSIDETDPAFPFIIDVNLGVITTTRALDYETDMDIWAIPVTVTDSTGLTDTKVLTVILQKVNEYSPMYPGDPTVCKEYSISEAQTVPFVIDILTATDADKGATLRYEISSVNPDVDYFFYNSKGELKLTTMLDFETQQTYELQLKATDNGERMTNPTQCVTITVVEANEHRPVFPPPSTVTINEQDGSVTNYCFTHIEATDDDDSSSGMLMYSLASEYPTDLFEIQGNQICLIGDLDYEQVQEAAVVLEACDKGTPSLCETVEILIDVVNINDEKPEFIGGDVFYKVIPEGTYTNKFLKQFWAEDDDLNTFNTVVYTLEDDFDGLFSADSDGKVTVTGELDRETKDMYEIVVVATDQDDASKFSKATLYLTVTDVNDNAPELNNAAYTCEVCENAEFMAVVTCQDINGNDIDLNSNGEITYALNCGHLDADKQPIFGVTTTPDEDGTYSASLVVLGDLDYESQQEYHIRLEAQDGGANPQSTFADITINICNKNDHPPIFDPVTYTEIIDEANANTGDYITQVTATDMDLGPEGDITYSFDATNMGDTSLVTLDPSMGVITFNQDVDYDDTIPANNVYEYKILATDGATPTGRTSDPVATVTFTIINNNNAPTFVQLPYSNTINENTGAGTPIFTVIATDPDAADQGNLKYSICAPHNYPVAIGEDSGEVTLTNAADLDYEELYNAETQEACFTFCVKVVDLDGNSDEENVKICLNNLDDEPPFLPNLYCEFETEGGSGILEISELYIPGSTLALLGGPTGAASDADGPSFPLTYTIISYVPNTMDIFEIIGDILVLKAPGFDYETAQQHVVQVEVKDSNDQSHTATFEFCVENKNDENPIAEDDRQCIDEGMYSSETILTIPATNPDGGALNFEIDGTDHGLFSLSSSGVLSVTGLLDFETLPPPNEYALTVRVFNPDCDGCETFITITICVNNVNDNAPMCNFPSAATNLAENTAPGVLRSYVSYVTDNDLPPFNAITFSSCNVAGVNPIGDATGDGTDDFLVTTGSNLLLVGPLEAQSIALYTICVLATDEGGETCQFIDTINVQNVNQAPEFEEPFYAASLPESAGPGTEIVCTAASDPDSDDLTYELDASCPFELSSDPSKPGCIVTPAGFTEDYEVTPNFYQCTVTVCDTGNLCDEVPLKVRFDDINDTPPKFAKDLYDDTCIPENTAAGTTVLTLYASDPEDPLNTFTSMISSTDDFFEVVDDENKVHIVLKETVDFETDTSPQLLTVTLVDGFDNALTSSAMVSICIEDVNEDEPIFVDPSTDNPLPDGQTYTASFTECEIVPDVTVAFTVKAIDDDSNAANGAGCGSDSITYSTLSGGAGIFSIDPSSGVVTFINTVDFDAIAFSGTITLTIQAEDGCGLKDVVDLVITITNCNEHPPIFNQVDGDCLDVLLKETATVGKVIGSILATDADKGDTITYEIHSTNPAIDVIWDLDLQAVVLNQDLASAGFGTGDEFTIAITAYDSGALYAPYTGKICVDVSNVNNNNPEITPVADVMLPEESIAGTPVASLVVSDADGDAVTCTLLNYNNLFELDPGTCNVIVKQQVDRDIVGQQVVFDLVVKASDGTLSSTETIKVTYEDINDNAPMGIVKNIAGDVVTYDTERIYLSEDATGCVAFVEATDIDEGLNAEIMYEIVEHPTFSIDQNGCVTIHSPVDFDDPEVEKVYDVEVVLKDKGTNPQQQMSTVNVIFEFVDANDNPPVSTVGQQPGPCHEENVNENNPISYQLDVSDDDASDPNNALEYEIISGNDDGNFDVSTTGLVTGGPLNYEDETMREIKIQVTDGGVPQNSIEICLKFNVKDLNDEPPIFPPGGIPPHTCVEGNPCVYPCHVNLQEDASDAFVFKLEASDLDAESVLVYSISNTELFSIDAGVITAIGPFDDSVQSMYLLTITVSDDVNTATYVLKVCINDVNKPPVFTEPSYNFNFNEQDTGGSPPCLTNPVPVDANDPDADVLEYSFCSTPSVPFTISSTTGEICLKPNTVYDSDVMPYSYDFIICVTDNKGGEDHALVSVDVYDINDNPPKFPTDDVTFEVPENTPTPNVLGVVTATDNDRTTPNKRITYTIDPATDPDNKYTIDPTTGEITLNNPVDYEDDESNTDTITVIACNDDTTTCSEKPVTIKTIDANECPKFTEATGYSTEITVAEDVASFSIPIPDSDPDTSALFGTLDYHVSGDDSSFTIDKDPEGDSLRYTGNPPFDYETKTNYLLTIVADDGFCKSNPYQIHVIITNANDNPPEFDKEVIRVRISETTSNGTPIETITATDADGDTITYTIMSTDTPEDDGFTLVGDKLTVNTDDLDHDVKNNYTYQVLATDGISTVMIDVIVEITDENEKPVFDETSFPSDNGSPKCVELDDTVNAMDNPIWTVVGIDYDLATTPNGMITYNIVGEGYEIFEIEEMNGQINIISGTTFAITSPKTYYLSVQVIDGGDPPLSSVAQLCITVNPTNQPPSIVQPPTTEVEDTKGDGDVVVELEVSDPDPDTTPNGQTTVTITNPGDPGIGDNFEIDENNNVVLKQPLDCSVQEYYTINIQVTDMGAVPLSDETSLHVVCVDERAPVFPPGPYEFCVDENSPMGYTVTKLAATDANGDIIEYKVENPYPFRVDMDNYLVTTEPFAYNPTNFVFTVSACEMMNAESCGTVTIDVCINDINDITPEIKPLEDTEICENEAEDKLVFFVEVTDPDTVGTIEYSLVNTDPTFPFTVTKNEAGKGEVRTSRSLDFETDPSPFKVCVMVTDGVNEAGPVCASVSVCNINEHPPIFNPETYTADVRDGTPKDTVLVDVDATDADDGPAGEIEYRIISGNDDNLVKIDPVTGEISLNEDAVAPTTPVVLDLVVKATDKSPTSPMSSNPDATVTITILPKPELCDCGERDGWLEPYKLGWEDLTVKDILKKFDQDCLPLEEKKARAKAYLDQLISELNGNKTEWEACQEEILEELESVFNSFATEVLLDRYSTCKCKLDDLEALLRELMALKERICSYEGRVSRKGRKSRSGKGGSKSRSPSGSCSRSRSKSKSKSGSRSPSKSPHPTSKPPGSPPRSPSPSKSGSRSPSKSSSKSSSRSRSPSKSSSKSTSPPRSPSKSSSKSTSPPRSPSKSSSKSSSRSRSPSKSASKSSSPPRSPSKSSSKSSSRSRSPSKSSSKSSSRSRSPSKSSSKSSSRSRSPSKSSSKSSSPPRSPSKSSSKSSSRSRSSSKSSSKSSSRSRSSSKSSSKSSSRSRSTSKSSSTNSKSSSRSRSGSKASSKSSSRSRSSSKSSSKSGSRSRSGSKSH